MAAATTNVRSRGPPCRTRRPARTSTWPPNPIQTALTLRIYAAAPDPHPDQPLPLPRYSFPLDLPPLHQSRLPFVGEREARRNGTPKAAPPRDGARDHQTNSRSRKPAPTAEHRSRRRRGRAQTSDVLSAVCSVVCGAGGSGGRRGGPSEAVPIKSARSTSKDRRASRRNQLPSARDKVRDANMETSRKNQDGLGGTSQRVSAEPGAIHQERTASARARLARQNPRRTRVTCGDARQLALCGPAGNASWFATCRRARAHLRRAGHGTDDRAQLGAARRGRRQSQREAGDEHAKRA